MTTPLLVLFLAIGQTPGPGPDDPVAAVKALYASAAYEEALTRLSDPATTGDGVLLAQYRALCLLALGRTDEADQTFTALIMQRPLYTISDSDFPPKIVALFHTIRHRVLPDAARALYTRGKTDYENKKYDYAAGEFKALMTVLTDPDLSGQDAAVGDLKTLADGFLGLANANLAETEKAAKAAPAPAPAASGPAPAAAPAAPPIYTSADKNVTPPVEVYSKLPEWNPTSLLGRSQTFRVILELMIDERGAVTSATVRPQVPEGYNQRLVAAVKEWRFKPANINGAPVPFRKAMEIVLEPKR